MEKGDPKNDAPKPRMKWEEMSKQQKIALIVFQKALNRKKEKENKE